MVPRKFNSAMRQEEQEEKKQLSNFEISRSLSFLLNISLARQLTDDEALRNALSRIFWPRLKFFVTFYDCCEEK